MSSGAAAVDAALEEIIEKIRSFTHAVDSALRLVPNVLLDLLGDALAKWNEFCRKVDAFFAIVEEIFSYGWGDADALRRAAERWQTCASDLLESAYDLLSHDAIKADTSWSGGAGDLYAARFQDQIDELRNSQDATERLSTVLEDHAEALDTFYANLTAGLIGAGASLGGLVVSAIALVPPVTPIGVVGLIVSAIGLIVSLYYLFKNEVADLERMGEIGAEALEQARSESSLAWPKIVTT